MHARRQVVASLLVVVGALALAPEALAAESGGWFGMSLNVEVGGFVLSPTVTAASLLEVAPNSPAASGDLRSGDQLLEVEGVVVAGGKAKDLQALMTKSAGETLHLKLKHSTGETYSAALKAVPRPT